MARYIGHKAADAVEVCEAPPSGAVVLTVDDTLDRKGVWRKVVDNNIDPNAAIVGTKLAAGAGVLAHLDGGGLLDNLTSITTRVIDSLTDGTYARTLAAALSGGKINLAAGSAGFANQLPSAQIGFGAVETSNLDTEAVTATKVADGAIGPRAIDRSTGWGTFPNGDFGAFSTSSGSEAPPDGWEVGPSTAWDTDVERASSLKTGVFAVRFVPTAATHSILSRELPVKGGRSYRWEVDWQASFASDDGVVTVYWFDAAMVAVGNNTVVSNGPIDDDTFTEESGYLTAPSTARFAKVAVGRLAGAGNVDFDRVELRLVDNGLAPIGSISAWMNHLTGTPSLPAGWLECNGQTISDADSPMNGQTLPDLNTSTSDDGYFLRGTKGTTGDLQAQTIPNHTHPASGLTFTGNAVADHRHQVGISGAAGTYSAVSANNRDDVFSNGFTSYGGGHTPSGTIGGNTSNPGGGVTENRPKAATIRWIMRIK